MDSKKPAAKKPFPSFGHYRSVTCGELKRPVGRTSESSAGIPSLWLKVSALSSMYEGDLSTKMPYDPVAKRYAWIGFVGGSLKRT